MRGRDVAAIAFLDAAGRSGLTDSAFDALEHRELATEVDLLLAEGDPEPALSFGGPASFLAALRERPYRGAIAIVEPVVDLDDDGAPVAARFLTLNDRVGAGRQKSGPGVGAAQERTCHHVELASDRAVIVHWQRFRLMNPLDLHGRFSGADHGAFGWIKLSYVLWCDGRAEVHCACSFFPSAWFYLDFLRVFRHDMLRSSPEEIECCLRSASGVPTGTTWGALDASTGYLHEIA